GKPVALETTAGRRWQADHIISAVPWHAAPQLFASLGGVDLRPIQAINASPITGVHLWYDREITARPHAVMVDTLAQWLFRQPFQSASQQGHYYQVVISATGDHRQLEKERLVGQITEELRHAFPAAGAAQLLHSRVVTDPNSVFSLSPQVDRIRPPARTALPWFHLAGDWIATGWPATMEGAVIGGRMAAASVLESERMSGISVDPGLKRGWLARRWIVA
ncbi:MAG: FAD-dependent oxidoreductase, partial [Pirellulales bacterium]|nr:FAD-dependent oxidoreductase [Pirellulales bacterium]